MTPAAYLKPALVPGKCRYCGCTAENPCRLPDGEPCNWMDTLRTLCSGQSCLRAFHSSPQPKKKRKPTPADIHALICGKNRRKHSFAFGMDSAGASRNSIKED